MVISNRHIKKRHSHMVEDDLRTIPLLCAIAKTVKTTDIVIDIGTGCGILAIQAARCGAKHVYAIDCDLEAIDFAKDVAKNAKVLNKITFIHDLTFNVKIPQKADVAICETVGSFAFDENILSTLTDAKKRLLKSNTRIIPARLELWGALCKTSPRLKRPADIALVKTRDLLSVPVCIEAVEFSKKIPKHLHKKVDLKTNYEGIVKSVVVWPKVIWSDTYLTDASPFEEPTHWMQGVMPIKPLHLKKGENIGFELIIKPSDDNSQFLTERLWRIRG